GVAATDGRRAAELHVAAAAQGASDGQRRGLVAAIVQHAPTGPNRGRATPGAARDSQRAGLDVHRAGIVERVEERGSGTRLEEGAGVGEVGEPHGVGGCRERSLVVEQAAAVEFPDAAPGRPAGVVQCALERDPSRYGQQPAYRYRGGPRAAHVAALPVESAADGQIPGAVDISEKGQVLIDRRCRRDCKCAAAAYAETAGAGQASDRLIGG